MDSQNKPPSRLLLLLDWLFTRTRKNLPAVIFFAVFVLASNAIYDLHQHHPSPLTQLDTENEADDSPSRDPSSIGGITPVARPSIHPRRNQRPQNDGRSDSRFSDTNEAQFEPPPNEYSAPVQGGANIPSMPAYVPSHTGTVSESHSVSTPTQTAQSTSDSSDDDSVHDIAQMPHPSATPFGFGGGGTSIVEPSFQSSASTLPPISGFSITSGGGTCTGTGILAQVSIGVIGVSFEY